MGMDGKYQVKWGDQFVPQQILSCWYCRGRFWLARQTGSPIVTWLRAELLSQQALSNITDLGTVVVGDGLLINHNGVLLVPTVPPPAGHNAANKNSTAEQTAEHNDKVYPPECPQVVIVVVAVHLRRCSGEGRTVPVHVAAILGAVLADTITAHPFVKYQVNLLSFMLSYITVKPLHNNNPMINLIDEQGKFNELLHQYPNCIANLAIFGSQSSGKSTLLNTAFQTHFPVLDSLQGRKRCTKGVWLENNGKFNIIDTEGFDSVQRDKSERIIQRQIALFCLALADVVIVNIWMNEIGRYQGGQIHILKAILKAANFLIESQSKTLLFVVKDCSKDADHQILRYELENQINKILAENPSKGPKSLKFNIDYYFMSHYIYHPQQYEKQANKLASIIRVRKSSMSHHDPKDRVAYLQHLWETIVSNDGEIDLRIEEEAIRTYVVNRIRDEVKESIEKLVVAEARIGKRNSYERFYEFYVKKGFEQIKSKLPKYVDEKTIKTQFFLLEESLEYVIQKHFTEVILPNEQAALLADSLQKQLQKAYNSIQLQKIITQQRKKVLQLYKLLVQGHKQAPILIKRFAEKITEESVNFERQVSHLFNIFETKLEMEINKELDKQVKKFKFDGAKLTQKFKTLCKQFQYNEWEVNIKEIWEKASHRVLTQKLTQRIEELSNDQQYSILASEKEADIITFHKNLQKQVEMFVQSLLQYFEQDDSGQHYIEKAKQKLRQCLEVALIREKKRFRVSMLIMGIFLVFFYGQFMLMMKYVGFKKKTRSYMSTLYVTLVVVIVIGSIAKRFINHQPSQQRST